MQCKRKLQSFGSANFNYFADVYKLCYTNIEKKYGNHNNLEKKVIKYSFALIYIFGPDLVLVPEIF